MSRLSIALSITLSWYVCCGYVNRTADIFPFHPTAAEEVSADKELCLGNSVLYPGLEGEFERSDPCLCGVFTSSCSLCRGGLLVSCPPVNSQMGRINIMGQAGAL